jgi:hypothetical protein
MGDGSRTRWADPAGAAGRRTGVPLRLISHGVPAAQPSLFRRSAATAARANADPTRFRPARARRSRLRTGGDAQWTRRRSGSPGQIMMVRRSGRYRENRQKHCGIPRHPAAHAETRVTTRETAQGPRHYGRVKNAASGRADSFRDLVVGITLEDVLAWKLPLPP